MVTAREYEKRKGIIRKYNWERDFFLKNKKCVLYLCKVPR